mmetsp:Transcript_8768/g.17092  ORF Transcript_8768/g.17092 Transcript_8768/m.17092 type:complete len:509 (+) Transcript_8768:111-1637(+)
MGGVIPKNFLYVKDKARYNSLGSVLNSKPVLWGIIAVLALSHLFRASHPATPSAVSVSGAEAIHLKFSDSRGLLPGGAGGTEDDDISTATEDNAEDEEWPIVMSYLAYGPPMRIRLLIENALTFTRDTTRIVLHISEKYLHNNSDGRDVDWEWLVAQNKSDSSRLMINPVSIKVRAFSGLILRGHLHNFNYTKTLMPKGEEFLFCMMSSDSALHRIGVEDYIQKHKISFTLGFSGDRNYDLDQWRETARRRMRQGFDTQKFGVIPTKRMRAYQGTEYYQETVMHTPLWKKLTKAGVIWDLGNASFINQFQHEGTFFPASMLDRFQRMLSDNNIPFQGVSYFAEEVWLPCYVIKNEHELLERFDFAPPLIGRYRANFWIDYCCIDRKETMKKVLTGDRSKDWPTGFDTMFGLKYMESPWEVETAIQVADLCRENPKKCVFYPNLGYWCDIDGFFKLHPEVQRDENLTPKEQLFLVGEFHKSKATGGTYLMLPTRRTSKALKPSLKKTKK